MLNKLVLCIVVIFSKGLAQPHCRCPDQSQVCFLPYPDECNMYIHCVQGTGHIRRCAFGTFFEPARQLCIFSAQANCAADPCRKKPYLTSYADADGSCRHYWRCSNGISNSDCCPEGTAYNEKAQRCTPNLLCRSKCEFRSASYQENTRPTVLTTQAPATSGCKLRMIRHNTRAFYHVDRPNQPFTCPEKTRFSESLCVCVDARNEPACKLEVLISFGKSYGKIENRATTIFIGHENVDILRGYGFFKGYSQIKVPFYTGNDNLSRKFGFQIRLYLLQGKKEYEEMDHLLLSNCDSVTGNTSSLEIKLNPVRHLMIYRASSTRGDWTELALPYKVKTWMNVLFIFNGSDLQAMLQYVDPKTDQVVEEVVSQPFTDTLKISPGPLRVGGCGGLDGILGFVDEIAMSFCKMDFPDVSQG